MFDLDPFEFFRLTIAWVATVYAAVATRKGRHVEWWVFGPLTDVLVRA